MAIRFDAAADRIVRTTNQLNYNSAYSWMGWFYGVSFTGAPVIHVVSDGNYSSICDEIYISVASSNALTSYIANSTWQFQFGTALSTATWYHIAAVRESNTVFKLYLNSVLDTTNTFDITGRTAAVRQECGAWSTGDNDPFNGRIAYIKEWTAALTLAEVAQEMRTIRPLRLANLRAWTPCLPGTSERLKDYGSGFNWTAGGTLTDEDQPSISWGSVSGRRRSVSNTIFTQGIDATAGKAFTLIKSAGKIVAIANTPAFTKTALVNKTLLYTAPDIATVKKQTGKNVAITNSNSVSIARVVAFVKEITASISNTVMFVKSIRKNINVAVGNISTFVKGAGKTIASTANSAVTQIRNVAKFITIAVNNTVVFIRTAIFLKTITASVGNALTVIKNVQKSITAISSLVLTQIRSTAKSVFVSTGSTITYTRTAHKNMSAAVTNVLTIIKQIGKNIPIAINNIVDITAQFISGGIVFDQTITAIMNTTVTVRKDASKIVLVSVATIVLITKQIQKYISVGITSSIQMIKQMTQLIVATVSSIASISTQTAASVFTTFYRHTKALILSTKKSDTISLDE